jgi:YCII-related domain
MANRRRTLAGVLPLALSFLPSARSHAQAQPTASAAEQSQGSLFAVEFRIGPNWDATKKAHEQAYFREHSASLKRLRDQGNLVLGARYSDKGFIVLAVPSEHEARSMIREDPSVQNNIFAYDLHEFNVFYSGCVQPRKRPL